MTPLTGSFRETIKEQLANREFRSAFVCGAVGARINGDFNTVESILREFVNGTVGFIELGRALQKSPKSLMRVLSTSINSNARNLSEIVAYLRKLEDTVLEVRASDDAAA